MPTKRKYLKRGYTARDSRVVSEYLTWIAMKHRCHNPKAQKFHLYGGRGIQVCPRWRDSFEAFLADMGSRPSPSHSLDRINSNGNYEPENCRWATIYQQNQNRRMGRFITLNGVTRCLAEWEKERGLGRSTIYQRIKNGMSERDAVLSPLTPGRKKIPSNTVL